MRTTTLSLALGLLASTASAKDVDAGFNAYNAAQVMVQKAGKSWEWGTAAEALLELYNPELSVFSGNPFPGGKIPQADPNTFALQYARQFINTNSQVFVGDSAVGDPASLGVSAILIGQSDSKYIDASNREADYILNDAPKYSNGAISHRPDVAELWADNVAMSFPFLAYLAVQNNDANLMSKTVTQIGLYRDVLKGGNSNWMHIIGPQSQDTGLWSTGNGWAAIGMVRVLHTLQKWSGSSGMTSQAGQLKSWIKEILDGAMGSGTDGGLLRNYLNDGGWFGEISGTALLSAVAYRMAVNDPGTFGQKYISWADNNRKSLAGKEGGNGIFSPAVNPYNWKDRAQFTSGSPEGQAFAVMLYTAYRDCANAGICNAPAPTTISKPGIGPIDILTVLNAPITFSEMPAPTGVACGGIDSCDADGCAGQFSGNVKTPVCTAGSKKGCQCKATDSTCGPRQSCDKNGCAGSFNGLGNVAYPVCTGNFVGCECLPSDSTCGPRQSCDKNDCHGSFNGLGNTPYPVCTNNFVGCKCDPQPDTCGPRESCDKNGCSGSFNGLGNVAYAKCTANFVGCDCENTATTCGSHASCDANGCNGSFNGLGNVAYAKCTNNFRNCDCLPQKDTCGPPQNCDNNGCSGKFSLNDGKAYCSNNFVGCECQASVNTCGNPQSCDSNNCAGKFSGNTPSPVCTNFFKGCVCKVTDNTCGAPQSCDANNCNGGYDAAGVARCQGNFKGCKCNPSKNTCGQPQNCDAGGCNGGFLSNSNTAVCQGNFKGCVCNPVPATCGQPQSCSINGCNGSYNNGNPICTGNFYGCPCRPDSIGNPPIPSHAPPPPPPPPENPGGTQLVINSGCVLVNGSPRCNSDAGHISAIYSGSYHVNADQGATSTAVILAGFDQSKWYSPFLSPGCQLNAHWPRNYGQVFFGADRCLYDASGNSIDGQCCSTPSSNNQVTNPWNDPRPAASCKRTPFFGGVHFEIYIKGWVNDNGAELFKQVGGCGLLTGKGFGTNNAIEVDGSNANIGSYEAQYLMAFNLPATFKTGCVGRAIGSAGGPPGNYC